MLGITPLQRAWEGITELIRLSALLLIHGSRVRCAITKGHVLPGIHLCTKQGANRHSQHGGWNYACIVPTNSAHDFGLKYPSPKMGRVV